MRELKNYQKDFDLIEEGKFTYLGRSKEKNKQSCCIVQ